VDSEKNKLTDEASNIITTIKQMESSLEDERDFSYNLNTQDMKITYPLVDCLRDLKEKFNTISRLHRERFEQVVKGGNKISQEAIAGLLASDVKNKLFMGVVQEARVAAASAQAISAAVGGGAAPT